MKLCTVRLIFFVSISPNNRQKSALCFKEKRKSKNLTMMKSTTNSQTGYADVITHQKDGFRAVLEAIAKSQQYTASAQTSRLSYETDEHLALCQKLQTIPALVENDPSMDETVKEICSTLKSIAKQNAVSAKWCSLLESSVSKIGSSSNLHPVARPNCISLYTHTRQLLRAFPSFFLTTHRNHQDTFLKFVELLQAVRNYFNTFVPSKNLKSKDDEYWKNVLRDCEITFGNVILRFTSIQTDLEKKGKSALDVCL